MNDTTTRRLAATSMIGAAALATAGFTGLGAVFDYPAILDEPTARDPRRLPRPPGGGVAVVRHAGARGRAARPDRRPARQVGAAAPAPVDRRPRHRRGSVQVIGLSRWLVLVPRFSHDALDPGTAATAIRRFELAHTWLGHALGETLGYALTAAFTIVVAASLPAVPRWVRRLGVLAAALVATGVLVPLGIDVAGLTNFAGYILWTLWLVVLAAALLRRSASTPRSLAGVVDVNKSALA